MTESNKTKKRFNFHDVVVRTLMDEPFFANISRRVEKHATRSIPTAGVRVNPATCQFEMLYNPDFFEALPDEQRKGVLLHEFYHLVLDHVTGRLPGGKVTKIWNFATDLAINSHIHNILPEFCLVPGRGPFESYPLAKSAEWYLQKLQQDPEMKKMMEGEGGDGQGEPGDGEGSGKGQLDDHSGWGEANQEQKQIARERLKKIVREAAGEANRNNQWGTVPANCRKDIEKLLTNQVDWKKVLRFFIQQSQRADKYSTQKRVNRRYRYIHPGRSVRRQAKIAISIDQSGSVSDGMLAAFFAELNGLAKYATFTVIPFDTRVEESLVFEWKKGSKYAHKRVMQGGTDFNPPTEYVNKQKFDGHIVLTDMCAPKPVPSKCQRMWLTTEECAANPYFQTKERVIPIVLDNHGY